METNTTTQATLDSASDDHNGTTRTAFRAVATGVVLVLIAALSLLGASPASAAAPSSTGFSPPVVEPGEATHAYVNCADDPGGTAIINVSKDGGAATSHLVTIGSDQGPGWLRLDASPS